MDKKNEKTFSDIFSSTEKEDSSITFDNISKTEDSSELSSKSGLTFDNLFDQASTKDLESTSTELQDTISLNSLFQNNSDSTSSLVEKNTGDQPIFEEEKNTFNENTLFSNSSELTEKSPNISTPFFENSSQNISTEKTEDTSENDISASNNNSYPNEDSKDVTDSNEDSENLSVSNLDNITTTSEGSHTKIENTSQQDTSSFDNIFETASKSSIQLPISETESTPVSQEKLSFFGDNLESDSSKISPEQPQDNSNNNPFFDFDNSNEKLDNSNEEINSSDSSLNNENPFFQLESSNAKTESSSSATPTTSLEVSSPENVEPPSQDNIDSLAPNSVEKQSIDESPKIENPFFGDDSQVEEIVPPKEEPNSEPIPESINALAVDNSQSNSPTSETNSEIKSTSPFFQEEEKKDETNPLFLNTLNLIENQTAEKEVNKLDTSKSKHFNVKIVKKKEPLFKFILGVISYAIFIWLLLIGITLLVYVLDIKIRAAKGDYSSPTFNAYVVLTGSMLPEIQVYDVVVTKKVEAKSLNEGDVITFASSDSRFAGTIITHRIIKKNYDSKTDTYSFQTKGDNNNVADSALVEQNNIYGKVILKIPKLGYLQEFLATDGGWIIVILIPCLTVISYDIVKLSKGLKRKKYKNIKVQK